MRYFARMDHGPSPALAKELDGHWHRYSYGFKGWVVDRQVEAEVGFSSDWLPATEDEISDAIEAYNNAS